MANTNSAVEAFQAECGVRVCPGCGEQVEGAGRGATGKTFCTKDCRQGFNNRMKAEGAPIAALVKAWTLTRHAKPGTREAEVCRYARSQLTQIASDFNERDAHHRRPDAVAYVETLMASGTVYMDRQGEGRKKAAPREATAKSIHDGKWIEVHVPGQGLMRFPVCGGIAV